MEITDPVFVTLQGFKHDLVIRIYFPVGRDEQ